MKNPKNIDIIHWSTYRNIVHYKYDEKNQHGEDQEANNVPLVVLPYNVFKRLPWGCEPQEGSLWSTEKYKKILFYDFQLILFENAQPFPQNVDFQRKNDVARISKMENVFIDFKLLISTFSLWKWLLEIVSRNISLK